MNGRIVDFGFRAAASRQALPFVRTLRLLLGKLAGNRINFCKQESRITEKRLTTLQFVSSEYMKLPLFVSSQQKYEDRFI